MSSTESAEDSAAAKGDGQSTATSEAEAPAAACILSVTTLYSGWLRVLKARIRLPDGVEVERHIEDHGDGVAVLPYDPVRRTGILIQTVRAPVTYKAVDEPVWEAVAGSIDDGESPESCARRETLEEVGIQVRELDHVHTMWTMPSVSTEQLHLFLSPITDGDRVAAGGGCPGENECITVVERPLAELWRLYEQRRLQDSKASFLLLSLKLKHPELFI